MNLDRDESPAAFWRSRWSIGWLVLAAVAAWFLWAEHRAHLLGALPYLLLLACPLMHVFMHHGHHHGSTDPATTGRAGDADQPGERS
jgi:hypothetical protein